MKIRCKIIQLNNYRNIIITTMEIQEMYRTSVERKTYVGCNAHAVVKFVIFKMILLFVNYKDKSE